ncbi:hypothetical protein [Streptomyces sp. 2-1]
MRRLVDGGKLAAERDGTGRRIIPGPVLAAHASNRPPMPVIEGVDP